MNFELIDGRSIAVFLIVVAVGVALAAARLAAVNRLDDDEYLTDAYLDWWGPGDVEEVAA